MLVLHVTYHVMPGKKEAFLQAIEEAEIDRSTRLEDGNVRYDYFYGAQQEDIVFLLEVWETEEAQKRHTRTEHFQALGTIKTAYVMETTVERYIGA